MRQVWRVARKRNQLGYGGHAGDVEVKVLYTPSRDQWSMGQGNAAFSQRAQRPSLGYAQGNDEPELHDQARSALVDHMQITAAFGLLEPRLMSACGNGPLSAKSGLIYF